MTDTVPNYNDAEAQRKGGQYEQAAQQFAALWQQRPSQMIGWRYAFCLRKLGRLDEAEQIAREAVDKYSGDKYTASELVWVLYEKNLKPAKEGSDLGRVLQAANEILILNLEGLALQKAVLAVMKVAKGRKKWEVVL